jgi:hypothetical protein
MRQFGTAIGYDPVTGGYWPPGVFEHYLYYKYVLRSPSDDLFSGEAFLTDFQKWKDTREDYTRFYTGVHQYNLDGSYITQHAGPASMPTSFDDNNKTKNSALQEIDPPTPVNINQGKAPPPAATAPPLPPPPVPPQRPATMPTSPRKTAKGGVTGLPAVPKQPPPTAQTLRAEEVDQLNEAIAAKNLPLDEIQEIQDLTAIVSSYEQKVPDEAEYLALVRDWLRYVRTTLIHLPKAERETYAQNYINQFFSPYK